MEGTELQEALDAFASKIAKQEGKKSQVKIGDIREILKIQNELLGSNSLYKRVVAWYKGQE